MASALGVKVVLEAEDKARGVLDQFGRTVVDLSEKSERGLVRMETAMARTTQSVRRMAVPLVAELVPAMDTTVGRMASVVTGALTLGSGLGALALAGAGLAGVLTGVLLTAWQKSTEKAQEFDRALRSMEVGRVSEQFNKASRELEGFRDELEKLDSLIARIDPRKLEQLIGPLSPRARRRRLEEQQSEAAGRAQVAGESLAQFTLEQELLRTEQTREATRLAQRGLADIGASPFTQQIRQIEREAEDLARGVKTGVPDVAAAARLRATIPFLERQRQQAFNVERAMAIPLGGEFVGVPTDAEASILGEQWRREVAEATSIAGFERERRRRMTPREVEEEGRRLNLETNLARAELTGAGEFVGVPTSAEAGVAGFETRREFQERSELLQVEKDLLETTRQRGPIITQADSEAARLTEIELGRRRQLVGVYDENKQALINLGAQYQEHIVLQEQLRRTDPAVGMLAGIKTLAEEWSSLGRVMERGALDFGNTLSSALGKALRGEDAGKAFWQSFTRIGTDTLAQFITGTLYRGLGGLLPGGAGAFPLGINAGLNVTGASPQALVALQQQGYSLVQGTGGQTVAVPMTTAALTRGQQAGAFLRQQEMAPGDPQYASAFYRPDFSFQGDYALSQTEPEYLDVARIGGGTGTAPTSYTGAALSTAAGALALYGLYESSRRGSMSPVGAVGGVATTALTGAAAASYLGFAGGAGAGVGAFLAIAAISAGEMRAASRRRNLRDRQTRQRLAQEVFGQLSDILGRAGALGPGHGAQGAVEWLLGAQVTLSAGFGRDATSVRAGDMLAGLAGFLGHPLADFLASRGYVASSYSRGPVGDFGELIAYASRIGINVAAFLDQALAQLTALGEAEREALETAEFRVVESYGGVTRTTYAPIAAADELLAVARTRAPVEFSSAMFKRQLEDDNVVAFAIDRIRAVMRDRDMIDINERNFTRPLI